MLLPVPYDHEREQYALKHGLLIKTGHFINLICWVMVFVGFILAYNDNTLYLLFFGFCLFVVVAYLSISNIIGCLYKPFPFSAHAQKVSEYWRRTTAPTIDVFLPICGEEIDVLRNTWQGVSEMMQHYQGKMQVYVLDDKDSVYAHQLASSFRFNYLTRPNRGEMKKAGNLKYGYLHSDGDFILILDADFRPQADMVYEMLPYMADEQNAIVQSPQYFDVKGLKGLQYGAGNIQRYFYKTVQHSRGAIGGSICVGSCALYRRKALDTVGGTYQIEHSEDVWTGYSLRAKGWKIQYIPIPLSKGLCPDDLHNFFKQQNRWCNGSLSLMRSSSFWQAPLPWYTKMSYISGFMYYLSSPFILLLPLQNFFLILHPQPMHWYLWLLFVPSVLFTTGFMLWHVYGDLSYGTILARMAALWSYTYAIFASFGKDKEGWTPTGEKQTFFTGFRRMAILSTTYFVFYVSTVFYAITAKHVHILDWHYALTTFWTATNILFQGMFMYGLWTYILSKYTQPTALPTESMIKSV